MEEGTVTCNSRKNYEYTAFGLCIQSEIKLNELIKITDKTSDAQVTIAYKNLTDNWKDIETGGRDFYFQNNRCLFLIPNVGIFAVLNGTKIFVSPFKDTEEDQIRLYVLGTCMGAILFQRKILPLHGSAIAIDGKAYAIVGDSGAGKSTTASALLQRGFQLISDDVIPVTISENNVPMVTPAYPQQKLWKESLHEFGMDMEGFKPIVQRENKFAVPVLSQFVHDRLPLAGIFELRKTREEKVVLSPIEKLQRFQTVYNHTYRNFFMEGTDLMSWHFQMSVNIINNVQLYEIKRPVSSFTANEVTEKILSTIKEVQTVG